MGRKPKYILLHSKEDADEFIDHAIRSGDQMADKSRLPEEIAGRKLRVEFVQGKRKLKRFMAYDEESETMYAVHPSSISFKYFNEE